MTNEQIILKLETNYGYEFNKSNEYEFCWLKQFAGDVQNVVDELDSTKNDSYPIAILKNEYYEWERTCEKWDQKTFPDAQKERLSKLRALKYAIKKLSEPSNNDYQRGFEAARAEYKATVLSLERRIEELKGALDV